MEVITAQEELGRARP